jgi:hypothetical protein
MTPQETIAKVIETYEWLIADWGDKIDPDGDFAKELEKIKALRISIGRMSSESYVAKNKHKK